MAFKNLEARYKEKVNQLYDGATRKFDNGKPSTGRNDDPLIVRKPGKGYWKSSESRSLPIFSAIEDVKRVTLFTLSVRGVLFLAKQQLLQTGNTFEQTRLINPVFAIGNAVPFLHLRRNLRAITKGAPGGPLIGKTDTSYANVRRLGQLQKSTYNSFIEAGANGIGGFLKKLAGPITSTISAVTAKKNVGEEFGYGEEGWKKSRPELNPNGFYPGLALISKIFGAGGRVQTERFTNINYGAISNTQYKTYTNLGTSSQLRYRVTLSDEVKRNETGQRIDVPFQAKNSSPQLGFIHNALFIPTDENEAVNRNMGVGFLGGTADKIRYGQLELGVYVTYLGLFPVKQTLPIIKRKTVPLNQTDTTIPIDSQQRSIAALAPDLLVKYNTFKYTDGTAPEVIEKRIKETIENRSNWYNEYAGGDAKQYLRYFTGDATSITSQGDDVRLNAQERANVRTDKSKPISYIKDPSNISKNNSLTVQTAYKKINNDFDDSIIVSFAMGTNNPIKFRAFIKDLTQSASPQYKDYQYIGRMEKFISYVTVEREISFKLGIVAFGEDEIDGVWRRINYLTGLVYPFGFNRGLYQPNIIKLTIGRVYYDQPGYITSLNTNFNQITETWDLKNQVPISAEIDMKFKLIEKKSKIAGSPFYKITEDMEGFSQQISTAGTGGEAVPVAANAETPDPALTVTPDSQTDRTNPPPTG